ncbi:MAG: replication-associated recombination protein A [bacterium]|nr:replication-associated recombination protein A [bacterium]MCP4798804.1 replication-associated recombination protein A [bacterium]
MSNNDLFPNNNNTKTGAPLPERMRPTTLDEVVGQPDLLAIGRPLRALTEGDTLPSMLFWGPPGCGKTTLARVIANSSSARFLEYSAVQVGSKELKLVMSEAGKLLRATGQKTIIFLDEIHRFNKAQQDALLPPVESGEVILIGATTENPSFEINSALLSRMRLFVLEELTRTNLKDLMIRALANDELLLKYNIEFDESAIDMLSILGDGDARTSLNLLEIAVLSAPNDTKTISSELLESMIQERTLRYDRVGEEHYNLISALHKSVRNSDPDASLYYLARMLEAGEDPLYISRRIVRMASEDIGMADPNALVQAIAARDTVQFLGMPECALALGQAVVYISMAPKSNAIYTAYSEASKIVKKGVSHPVPKHIRNAPTKMMKQLGYGKGYEYAHDTEEGVTAMSCLPNAIKDKRFYHPTERGIEKRYKERLESILKWRKEKEK